MVSVDTGSGLPPVPPPVGQPVDSGTAPPPITDAVRFRIVHAAPHAPPLDPYLLPAGAPLDTLPTLQPFAYGSLALTADLVRAPGHYVVEFTDAGTTHVVLQSGDINAAAGELLTVVWGRTRTSRSGWTWCRGHPERTRGDGKWTSKGGGTPSRRAPASTSRWCRVYFVSWVKRSGFSIPLA